MTPFTGQKNPNHSHTFSAHHVQITVQTTVHDHKNKRHALKRHTLTHRRPHNTAHTISRAHATKLNQRKSRGPKKFTDILCFGSCTLLYIHRPITHPSARSHTRKLTQESQHPRRSHQDCTPRTSSAFLRDPAKLCSLTLDTAVSQ